jgi:putative methyltransferase
MSLYHEAAGILDTVNKGKTSLKAEIFGKKTWKTDGKTLFALTSEAAKWSSILAEVVEKSGILKIEKQVRTLAYLRTNPEDCQCIRTDTQCCSCHLHWHWC